MALPFLACATVAHSQQAASVFSRVQQLVNAGNRALARSVADSALSVARPGSLEFAEALYARAYGSADAAAAERDYMRLVLEFPQSPRLEDALLAAGQFRMARGDRAGARRQFERLALEFPNGANSARASFWAGRIALESGETPRGCALLDLASDRAGDDVEFRNQVEYLRARCSLPRVVGGPDSAARDSTSGAPTPLEQAHEYSVQVAAFARQRDAEALARRLRQRGFPVRVAGTRAPYRVRVGRYATQELAAAAAVRMKRSGVSGLVVEAEPR